MYVRLPAEARGALIDLAEREFRDPRDQAAVLIVESLYASGLLRKESEDRVAVEAPTT